MSLLARLVVLRASRASAALVQLQQAIDRAVVDGAPCSDEQLERLCILRELAVVQMEALAPRLRRNPSLRNVVDATCRAYRAWAEQDGGTEQELRSADDLAARMLELRDETTVLEEREIESQAPAVMLASIR